MVGHFECKLDTSLMKMLLRFGKLVLTMWHYTSQTKIFAQL